MANKHTAYGTESFVAPLLMGSPWRTLQYFMKWICVIVGVVVGSALFAGLYYFRVHEVGSQTAMAIMAPVFATAAVLTLLLYRSEAVLLAQGLGWRLDRIFLTYGLFVFVYLTTLHLASLVGWVMLGIAAIGFVLGVLSYPSLKAGVMDVAATAFRYGLVIVIFAVMGGGNPSNFSRHQTARNALDWMPNASIVRRAKASEVYRKRRAKTDLDVTQTIT